MTIIIIIITIITTTLCNTRIVTERLILTRVAIVTCFHGCCVCAWRHILISKVTIKLDLCVSIEFGLYGCHGNQMPILVIIAQPDGSTPWITIQFGLCVSSRTGLLIDIDIVWQWSSAWTCIMATCHTEVTGLVRRMMTTTMMMVMMMMTTTGLILTTITSIVAAKADTANSPHQIAQRNTTLGKFNPYPTAFPYGNGMVLHFYQQQESSTTKTVHKVINKRLKTHV